ncbi:trichothecene efflux pump [Phialemonium atrogriseum]|uniref:Trichothecene efflux pump n=1 Tax=Phialemonium atrogriseum TaxID=1093897 RepID=A0AAJ0BTE6_9PEZI|nr:trichothecene efflux pump [Phialemonium atrogriseum]KAK1762784.1 trichothecene efflux pump [Phialemonium atrogriseum]
MSFSNDSSMATPKMAEEAEKQVEYANDEVTVTAAAEEEEHFKMTPAKLLAMASFQLGYMSDVFVVSMVASTLTAINDDIGPDSSYTWMVTALVLGGAVFSPAIGRVSDIFGRRNFLLIGNVIAAVGCAVAATAHSVKTVIGASCLIGIASSMHQLAWSCLGELVPKRSRGFALGIFQLSLLPAAGFSPIIGNAMVKHASWRYVYWLPFAMDCLCLVLVFFFYHPINQYIKEENKTRLQQAMSLDWVGFFLLLSGLVLFLLGISFGGNVFPWKSVKTLAPILVGFALLVALGLWEAYMDLEYPLFPRKVLRNVRGVTMVAVGVFLLGMLYYSTSVLWPQQVTSLYTQDPLKIGWYASTVGLTGSVFGPVAGYLFRKFRHARLMLTFYVLALTVVSGAQSIVSPTSNVGSTVLTVLVGGFVSAATIVSTAMIQLGVPHEYIGIATGLAITMRSIGGSVGTTIYSSVLTSKLKHYLFQYAATPLAKAGVDPQTIPALLAALLGGSVTDSVVTSQSPEVLGIAANGIKQAYAHSFRIVYLITIAFGVLGTICVAFSSDVDHLMTGGIDIKLDEGAKLRANDDTGGGHIHRQGEEDE